MSAARPTIEPLLSGFASRLRFPQLLVITAALFLFDLLVPDLLPFVDELLLGLATLLFASWKRKIKTRPAGAVIDRDPQK